jgi:HPt (histidine-containing phosphotransfer) domain-containing protein
MKGRIVLVGVSEPELLTQALSNLGLVVEAAASDWEAAESLERDDRCAAVVLGTRLDDETRTDFSTQLSDRSPPVPVAWQGQGQGAPAGVALVLDPQSDPAVAARQLDKLVQPDPSFEAELAALRAEYAAVLPARLEELEQALGALARSPEQRLVAARLAHRLAGTAGSYGFAAVSAVCRELELTLELAQPLDAQRVAASLERARHGLR